MSKRLAVGLLGEAEARLAERPLGAGRSWAWCLLRCGLLLALMLVVGVVTGATEVIKVAGRGEVAVQVARKAKEQAALNQQALAQAEEMAKRKAVKQAVVQVYGTESSLGPNAHAILKGAADNSAAFILDKNVTSAGIVDGKAVVEVVVQVDGKGLRDFLESNYGLNLAVNTSTGFKVYVLTYTVQGMDPSRAQPQVLHEEYVEDQKNVHSSSYAKSKTNANASASSSSLQASYAASDQGAAKYKASGSVNYSAKAAESASAGAGASGFAAGSGGVGYMSARESASYDQSASERLKMKQSQSGSAEWDQRESASVDARSAQSSSSYSHNARAGSSYGDTSRYVRHVVDYADPTKKGAGTTNTVRAKLEGMYTNAGFSVATLDVNLMDRDFPTEDDLIHTVIQTLKSMPQVSPDDYVAIAINSLTPVSTDSHQFTSDITYRLVRVGDGVNLLPSDSVVGDSGDQPVSNDQGALWATDAALYKTDQVLPEEITKALRRMQAGEAAASAAEATSYAIRVDNVASPAATLPLTQALRSQGFGVNFSFNGASKSETITVTLNGKSGQDVMAAMEPLLGSYDVGSMDDHSTVLRAK